MFLEYKDSINALDLPLQWGIVDHTSDQTIQRVETKKKIDQDLHISETINSERFSLDLKDMPTYSRYSYFQQPLTQIVSQTSCNSPTNVKKINATEHQNIFSSKRENDFKQKSTMSN